MLRVGDRTGRTLPAHLSSGGEAVLAMLDDDRAAAVLDGLDATATAQVVRELRAVRRRGFAVNAPTARYTRERQPVRRSALAEAAGAIARDSDAS